MANELKNLADQVSGLEDAEDSAIALLEAISKALADLAGQEKIDPAAVQALADRISADKEKLAAAVVANTPADAGATSARAAKKK